MNSVIHSFTEYPGGNGYCLHRNRKEGLGAWLASASPEYKPQYYPHRHHQKKKKKRKKLETT
jgi:hypothetical protein